METTEGVLWGHQSVPSFFAESLLLFAEASEDQICCIQEGLRDICKASGQSINFKNSLIYFSPNLPKQDTQSLSTMMGIARTSEQGFYLGHYLLHHGSDKQGPSRLLHRVKAHLDGCKSRCLSRAGCLTLSKSVLNGMTIFHMQIQRLPTWAHKVLDNCVRQCVCWSSEGR